MARALGAALLEGEQLLGTEGLVVDLGRGLDEILKVCAEKEVAEVDEFAVVLILDVDNTPPVLAAPDLLAVDNDGLLGTNNSEGNEVLVQRSAGEFDFRTVSLARHTLIWVFRARSSSSSSSLSYGYILRLWKANSSLMRSLKA
jgi:hypothetical protein